MPTLEIPFIPDPAGDVVLLTDAERLRLTATASDWDKEAEKQEAAAQRENAEECRSRAEDVREELATDADLGDDPRTQTAVISYKEPDRDDRDAVMEAATSAGPNAALALHAAKRAAVERLVPTWNATDGEPQPIPYRLWPTIENACYAAIDFNPSEDRRFFSMRSRAASPGSSPAASPSRT